MERLGAELLVPAVTSFGKVEDEGGGGGDSGSGGGTGTANSAIVTLVVQLSAYPAIGIGRERRNIIAADRNLPGDEILMLYYPSHEGY